jgi:hypothetical protein
MHLTALLLLVSPVLAGGDWPPQGENDPKITVDQALTDDSAGFETFELSVTIEDHPPIVLGDVDKHGKEKWRQMGVDADTVRVRLLKGTPDLYLIEWLGLTGGGSGNVIPYRYRISRTESPANVASGTVILSGRGGWSNQYSATSEIEYRDDNLIIAESHLVVHTTTEPKPLHHFVPEKGDFWQAKLQTKIERRYAITEDGAELKRATFGYRVQKGDKCNDVLGVFKLHEQWLEQPDLPKPGEWITADVPVEQAIKRWPTTEAEK